MDKSKQKIIIVLAMHGMPPKDFPQEEKKEFMRLHAQVGHKSPSPLKELHDSLEKKMRDWPRNPENDPFHQAANELASSLREKTKLEVIVGYNEFCAPSCDEAMDQAASKKPDRVMVMTPMMIRGGNHSEEEIPESIELAKKRHPNISFEYAWPFDNESMAGFFAEQVSQRL